MLSLSSLSKSKKENGGVEGAVIELSKQVGELAKNVMMFEGYYLAGRDNSPKYKTSKGEIANELSDIFFMVVRIADHYQINLEKAHIKELEIAANHPHMKQKSPKKSC